MYAENLEKISIPAVFDSRWVAASLGYLKRRKAIWKITSCCYQQYTGTHECYLDEEGKNILVPGTVINAATYHSMTAWQNPLNNTAVLGTQAFGELQSDDFMTRVIVLVLNLASSQGTMALNQKEA